MRFTFQNMLLHKYSGLSEFMTKYPSVLIEVIKYKVYPKISCHLMCTCVCEICKVFYYFCQMILRLSNFNSNRLMLCLMAVITFSHQKEVLSLPQCTAEETQILPTKYFSSYIYMQFVYRL